MCKGGGGGGDSDDTIEADEALDATRTTATLQSLSALFSESDLWRPEYDMEDSFLCDRPSFSITLDLSAGSLILTRKEGLSKEAQEEFERMMDTIENEFDAFKAELEAQGIDTQAFQSHRGEEGLTIKIPTTEHFHAFVQRLVDKNLLATNPEQKQHTTEAAATKNQDEPSTAPNPFDINQGPGFDD